MAKRASKRINAGILSKLTNRLFSKADPQALANAVAEAQAVLSNEVKVIYRHPHLYAHRDKDFNPDSHQTSTQQHEQG